MGKRSKLRRLHAAEERKRDACTVDPAQFIVRSNDLKQRPGYAHGCASVTQGLLNAGEDIRNANDMLVMLSCAAREKLARYHDFPESFGALHPLFDNIHRKTFFNPPKPSDDKQQLREELIRTLPWRERARVRTGLRPAYGVISVHHDMHQRGNGKDEPDRIRRLALTQMQYADNWEWVYEDAPDKVHYGSAATMTHPLICDGPLAGFNTMDEYYNAIREGRFTPQQPVEDVEDRWSLLSQAFYRAIDVSNAMAQRKRDALEVYWWMEQDITAQRGSDTLARIALEYLAHRVGFDVPLVKEKVYLARYAQCRTLEDFIGGWEKGEYFDPHATSRQVLDWQRSVAETQGAGALRGTNGYAHFSTPPCAMRRPCK